MTRRKTTEMSILPPDVHNALRQLLQALPSADNAARTQAEESLNNEWVVARPEVLLMGLVEHMQATEDPTVNAYDGLLGQRAYDFNEHRHAPLPLFSSAAWQQRRGKLLVARSRKNYSSLYKTRRKSLFASDCCNASKANPCPRLDTRLVMQWPRLPGNMRKMVRFNHRLSETNCSVYYSVVSLPCALLGDVGLESHSQNHHLIIVFRHQ